MHHWILLKPTMRCILTRIWIKTWKKKKKEKVTFPIPYSLKGGSAPPPWTVDVHKLFRILLYRIFVSSPFIYLIIYLSVWTHRYLFYTSGYNPALYCLFFYSYCSSVSHWEFFQVGCVSLWHSPIILVFWVLLYFLVLQDAPGSSCIITCPRPRISHFFKELLFVLLENGL